MAKTKAEKLTDYICRKMVEDNIPAISIIVDREKGRLNVALDKTDVGKEISTSMVLDAMLNGGENAPYLMNAILSAACMLLAESEVLEKRAYELIKQFKGAQKEAITIKNRGEA